MTKIQAIIMDGDGSTITHDKKFPDNLRELMIANPQIKWIMATGRSLDFLRLLPIVEYLTPNIPHILDGGSRLNHLDGSVYQDFFITPSEIELFFQQLNINQVDFLYYYLDEEHSFFYSQTIETWINYLTFSTAKITSEITQFKEWCHQFPPTKIFLRVKEQIVLNGLTWHQNDNNIDLTAKDISKGSACVNLLKHLRLKPSQVAFVFNDRNDLPLVEHPELQEITKIKVGDYLPQIKAEYNVSTPYDVAEVLAKLI